MLLFSCASFVVCLSLWLCMCSIWKRSFTLSYTFYSLVFLFRFQNEHDIAIWCFFRYIYTNTLMYICLSEWSGRQLIGVFNTLLYIIGVFFFKLHFHTYATPKLFIELSFFYFCFVVVLAFVVVVVTGLVYWYANIHEIRLTVNSWQRLWLYHVVYLWIFVNLLITYTNK